MPATLIQYDAQSRMCYRTEGTVLNLSQGGLLVTVPVPALAELPLWAHLRIGNEVMQLRGKQVRCIPLGDDLHGISLEFDLSHIEDIVKIGMYVEGLLMRP